MRSTLPIEANQDSPELAILVDRALRQTRERGGKYAVVPLPWMRAWSVSVEQDGSEFEWASCCWVPVEHRANPSVWNWDELPWDDDGNMIICLLPFEHEGPCGPELEGIGCVHREVVPVD